MIQAQNSIIKTKGHEVALHLASGEVISSSLQRYFSLRFSFTSVTTSTLGSRMRFFMVCLRKFSFSCGGLILELSESMKSLGFYEWISLKMLGLFTCSFEKLTYPPFTGIYYLRALLALIVCFLRSSAFLKWERAYPLKFFQIDYWLTATFSFYSLPFSMSLSRICYVGETETGPSVTSVLGYSLTLLSATTGALMLIFGTAFTIFYTSSTFLLVLR